MNSSYFLSLTTLSILVLASLSAQAQTTTLNTVPEGAVTVTLPAITANQTFTSFISLPLTADPTYTGIVSTVTASSTNGHTSNADTISVADSPAPWTTNSMSGLYFVKFLTGQEKGRFILIQSNTTNSLTLDIQDNTLQTVGLSTSGFAVTPGAAGTGDSFEIFPADTLATLFGDGSTNNPLLLIGGSGTPTQAFVAADVIAIYSQKLSRFQSYFFNSTAGFWELKGSSISANNTVLYPYGGLSIFRKALSGARASIPLTLMGRIAEVPALVKAQTNATAFGSTTYPVDMTLSQLKLQLGPNWQTSTSPGLADTVSVWSNTLSRFQTYFQLPDATWRQSTNPNGTTDVGLTTTIHAGDFIYVFQRKTVAGAATFLPTTMPYTLTNTTF